ncbi:hypothetical protein SAVCW2_41620 [Streptomyces avermitilis]|nr:hypothetical protein SAVCW2_41620 [Streptomyces avermitilis]
MGDHFQTIVDLDASAGEAPELAARVIEWLVTEGIVLAERTDCVLGRPLGHPPGRTGGGRWGRTPTWTRPTVSPSTPGVRLSTPARAARSR